MMKVLFVYLLGLMSSSALERPLIPNSYVAPVLRAVQLRDVSETCFGNSTDDGTWKCADCRTAQKCGNTAEPTMKITCASQYPGRPYCDSSVKVIGKKCVKDPKVCEQDTNVFKCPDIGNYPSLLNCKEFYWCSKKGDNGIKNICKYSANYNHQKKDCLTNSVCYTVKADCGKDFKVIPYKLDSNLYVTCQGDKAPILGKCPNGLGWDSDILDCDFVCKEEGTFPSPDQNDKQHYYRCSLNGRVLEKEKLECPAGTSFDPDFKNCVPSSEGGGGGGDGGAGSGDDSVGFAELM